MAKPENIQKSLIRHSRAGGNPDLSSSGIFRNYSGLIFWIPACAGMTGIDFWFKLNFAKVSGRLNILIFRRPLPNSLKNISNAPISKISGRLKTVCFSDGLYDEDSNTYA
ncbi:hypothetical protein [Neisseria sp. CCUG12390]|uniref:hypothetical protein n=1 Tax=Neisseria sp. CCUG12390 TaxID=3392035 RepID=UPI003A0FDFC0